MSKRTSIIDQARRALEKPISFDEFRAKLSARDGGNIDRHIAAMEQEPDDAHLKLWKRVACSLATLAGHAVTTTGQQVVSFFVADGKYRMQVFALEDQRDGKVVIYAPDALKEALASKLLRPPTRDVPDSTLHQIDDRHTLSVEQLTAQNTPNPAAFYKHMLGWNRTAVRITLLTHANETQIAAAETLCSVAALKWSAAAKGSKIGPDDEPVAVSR